MNTVLVIAPHPDDETLGCGGALLKHRDQGDETHWLIMTNLHESEGFTKERIASRKAEIDKVAERYGFSSVHQSEFATTKLDVLPVGDLVSTVSSVVSTVKSDTIYMPFPGDVHTDHRAVFDAALACTKSFRYPSVKHVRVYETLSETEFGIRPDTMKFSPNMWIDISDHIDEKIEIMALYDGEMGDFPFPRSEENIRALASLRGSTIGVLAAEAFMSLKEIL